MKILTPVLLVLMLLFGSGYAKAISIAQIMAPEFGMKQNVIRICDEITKAAKANPEEELRAAVAHKDQVIEKTNMPSFTGDEAKHISLGKELISICMVGMYYATKYLSHDEKQFDKYTDEFMPGLTYATYLLGASGPKLSDEKRQEIQDKIYIPLLQELVLHGQK